VSVTDKETNNKHMFINLFEVT